MSQIWKWNDVELEIDMQDVDFQEKYERAFEILEKEEKEVMKIGKLSEMTRSYCNMFFHLFDNIFGENTSEKLFNGKINEALVNDCYDSFLALCKKDVDEINKRRMARASKYKVKNSRK